MTPPAPPGPAPRATGRCLCGGVRYALHGPLRPVVECHCDTCRRFTGSLWHATAARREHVTVHDSGTLRWYASSAHARRGFCGACGAGLFMDNPARPYLAVTAGTLDKPTGLRLAVRIFAAEAGDYYPLPGDLPLRDDARHGLADPDAWE